MFLFDDIKESDISDAVLDSIKGFDSQVQSLSDLLSFGLNDQKYSAFYQVTDLISTGISGICIAIAVVMAYFAIVKEGISLRGDWKKVVTILLRLSISKGLIDASTQFITWIYSFPAAITQKVIEVTTNKGSGLLEQIFNPQDILNGLGITKDSGDISKFVALQYAKFMGFAFYLLSIIIFIIAVARILKIYTLLSFGAIAFAKIPLYGFSACKDYLKELCALGLQGGIIAASVCFFELSNVALKDICNTGTWGTLGTIIVLAISMILLIFKSEELARKVI